MKMKTFNLLTFLFFILFCFTQCEPSDGIRLKKGMTISTSAIVSNAVFSIVGNKNSLEEPIINITGDNIVVDFNGAVLNGADAEMQPNEFEGLGILIKKGKNITIKNLTVKGYKCGLMALEVDSLTLINCDMSYNYRQRLKSMETAADKADDLRTATNEKGERLQNLAAVYLGDCDNAVVKNLTITEGMNGLILSNCQHGIFYNNKIQFNSGIGIQLKNNSSGNKIKHNQLDWNVRGYQMLYADGQGAAGVLLAKNANRNEIAYNSATHCSVGLAVLGDENVVYSNDFSYAPTNGLEIRGSGNKILNNVFLDSYHGIWSEGARNTLFLGNFFNHHETGFLIKKGQNNVIRENELKDCSIGIKLEGGGQKAAKNLVKEDRNTDNKCAAIDHNVFKKVKNPLHFANTTATRAVLNYFLDFETLLIETENEGLIMAQNKENVAVDELPKQKNTILTYAIGSEPDGMNAMLPSSQLQGLSYLLMKEWGPYSFRYPVLRLRTVNNAGEYVFALLGPYGNWKLKNGEGMERISLKSGTVPTTLVVRPSQESVPLKIELEFIGEAITTQFGEVFPKGTPFLLTYERER